MKIFWGANLLFAFGALAYWPGAASAVTPPPTMDPLFYGDATAAVHYGSFVVAGDHKGFRGNTPGATGATTYTTGQASSAVSITGNQHLHAEAHTFADAVTPELSFFADALTALLYSFAIIGPDSVLVPLHLVGSLTTSGGRSIEGSYGLAEASFSLQGQNSLIAGSQFAHSQCSTGLEATCGTVDFQLDFDAFAYSGGSIGNLLQVTLGASASAKSPSEK
jgi:hypothetical protein